MPPSLKNIYKEINLDIGLPIPGHGDLTSWAKQGGIPFECYVDSRT